MTQTVYPPVLELLGPESSGKTTLARLFLEAFSEHKVLVIETDPDNSVLVAVYPQLGEDTGTLADVLALATSQPLTASIRDYAFQELPVVVTGQGEVMCLGQLAEDLDTHQRDVLTYGFPRLLKSCDLIIVDGAIPSMLADVFRPFRPKPVLVIAPTEEDEIFCRQADYPQAAVLFSKATSIDELPPTAARRLASGEWTLMGRLPSLPKPQDTFTELPGDIIDCFMRLDLPLSGLGKSLQPDSATLPRWQDDSP